ncbi:MAG: metal-dependent transcriptional regulator [bacterium]|nr:metal-dependent transcriptional regulator [bacterium]
MSVEVKKISSNMEDYLEGIAFLKREKGVARVNDISKLLCVKNSSVNSALVTLARSGLVVHERYGAAELTVEGKRLASGVQQKHNTLFRFLSNILKVGKNTAQDDACKMEHSISQVTLEKLIKFIKHVERCPEFNRQDMSKGKEKTMSKRG